MIEVRFRSFAELVGFPSCLGPASPCETHGTTVLALRFDGGVLVLADRRATAGNLIMFDQAEKVLPLDDHTVAAISGAYGRSLEVCRYLRHSFKFYARMHLQELSLEGKLMEIGRALAANQADALAGVGFFLPIVAAYDPRSDQFGVYFFDGAGARFTNGAFACAGSGSERIRGVFEYLQRTKGPFAARPMEEVLREGLVLLDIAAALDSATGGFGKVPPVVRVLDRGGNRPLEGSELASAIEDVQRLG